MPKLNWKIILYDITEAREQLEHIERRARNEKKPNEYELQTMLEHAYHHLNFAWNVRRVSTKRYANLSDAEFNQWSKFPKEMEKQKIKKKKKSKGKK
jgi:hypothetical protein